MAKTPDPKKTKKDLEEEGDVGTEPAIDEGAPDEDASEQNPPETAGPDDKPSDKPSSVTIVGKGSLSIMADGKANTIERGKKITVTPELLAALREKGEEIEEHK